MGNGPFHLIWVSLTLLYGFRVWRSRTTAVVLGVVMATTGAALAFVVVHGQKEIDEVAEVPLMASMFLVMAWHAQRRQRAVEEASRSAETERRVRIVNANSSETRRTNCALPSRWHEVMPN